MPPVFYLDLWPISNPLMLVHDPDVASQITQAKNLAKHPVNSKVLGPLVGSHSVVTAEGQEWKILRSILNSGFSSQYLSTLIHLLLRHGLVFKDRISNYASTGEVFPIEETATALTIDVIGEVVLGKNFDSQRRSSELALHFQKAVAPFKWWHSVQQDRIIEKMIRERHAQTRSTDSAGTRAAVDLFLQAYREEKMGTQGKSGSRPDELDPEFMHLARNNVKTLLLGGHDTHVELGVFANLRHSNFIHDRLHPGPPLLTQNTHELARIRAEHDAIFGPDPSQAASILLSEPRLLNNLPLTTAAIKETLRLFPAGSTTRTTLPPHPVQTVAFRDGQQLPLAGEQIWIAHYGFGQRADLWPEPRKFMIDRFMPGGPTPPPKDAWRPFEKGPRGCLGLELAMMELRLVLVLLCREFDFETAYAEDAPRAPPEHGVQGGRGYQIIEFAAKPVGHMPMRARRRGMDDTGE
ncbi:hypothetical protein AYL99_10074 [Fonsecaea erecta]|uniref:Cytochrome P450 n=1 Tax=Fonsecaea erecta TaxID=1367422 RepID=A0A178Z8A0_9EURO|nr:hypothetical protein AYL99_10074 [Fonsecaea erecta]OAP55922.1 hypothetical protein AYL99_10074 [Fonsecaea erecta]